MVVLLSFAGVDALYAQTCLDCHEESQPPAHSTHVSVPCARCHIEHEEFPHSPEATSLGCAQCHSAEADETALGVHWRAREEGNDAAPDCGTCHGGAHTVSFPGTTPYRRETIETCGMCHTEQAASFKESVHGTALSAGIREAPTCTDCHGEHAIQSPLEAGSPTQVLQIRETCAQCHADVALMARFGLPTDRVVSFDASFHGLANRAGSQTVANCSSCHGIHDILPSLDPRSKIHAANLADTCGSCHPGAGSRFALEPIHVLEGEGQNLIADLIRNIYLVLIPVVIGLMAVHNGGDWLRKLVGRAGGSSPSVLPVVMEVRMLPAERLQHALLAISFIVLTWTGFALKFPEQFWAYPLVMWESAWPVRGVVHRIAAAVFMATACLHMVALLSRPRLREHWRQLLPRRADVRQAVAGFAYNLGVRRHRPKSASYSYVEKAEYWAVVWGGVLMSASGIILWAHDFFLRNLPKALIDVATVVHYYEAVLAALAIVVWHFYFVIFDPDVYPMNTAWLTGRGPRHAEEERKGTARHAGTHHAFASLGEDRQQDSDQKPK